MEDSKYMISCDSVSKEYKIWRDSSSRLKAPIWALLGRPFSKNKKENPYYTPFTALKDVSFNLRRGESIGIIGRNGSGKSTLLQILAGTLQPTSGSAQLNGRVAALLELGSGFNPEFSGRENVYLYASILGFNRKATSKIFNSIVEFSELDRFIDQPLRTYSSGMTIRLAFSVRIHLDPEVLIIDEALAVGDFYFVQKCTRFIREFIKNKTLVLVTHDLSSVQNLCKRCIWLKDGEVQFDGSPKDAVERYLAHYHSENLQQETKVEDGPAEGTKIESINKDLDAEHYDQRSSIERSSLPANEWEVLLLKEPSGSFGTGEAKITSCKLEDKDGRILTGVVGSEIVCLTIEVEALSDVEDPIFGFNLKDRLGQYIFGDNTYLQNRGHALRLKPGSAARVQFEFRMPILHPGEYAFTAAIAKGTQENHQHIQWIHEALLIRSESPVTHQGLCGVPIHRITTEIR